MYEALWRQKEERFALRRDEIKQLYKPMWRDVFKRQRDELREFDAGFVGRIRIAMRRGDLGGMTQAVFNGSTMRGELIRYHESERKDLGGKQKARIRDASREVTKAWKYDRDQLKALHQEQDKARLADTKAKTDAMWKDKSRPTTKDQANDAQKGFEPSADRRKPANKARRNSLEAFFGDDTEGLEKARKQQAERRERNKERKRNRTRQRDDGGRNMDR